MKYVERLERIVRDEKKAAFLAALQSWDRAFLKMLVGRGA